MADFVHCNSCIRLPANGSGTFFLGTCSHILCQKCVQKTAIPPANVTNPKQPHLCIMCKQPGRFYEINRDMPSQMTQFFRDPKDICENFAKQIKQVLDFRSQHRNRLFKAQSEQFKRCTTMYKKLQVEYKKRLESEKSALSETQRCKEQLKAAKDKIEENERELARLRQLVQHPHHKTPNRHSGGGSHGTVLSTQHSEVSFVGVCTSTPIHERGGIKPNKPTNIFGVGDRLSPIVPADYQLTTPAMLGIGSGRNHLGRAERDRQEFY